jgi:hypothetical protein
MNSPIQARPVGRGLSRLTNGASQSCDIFACGGAIINCASQCIPNPLSPGCIACLGPAWNSCKDCF